MLQGVVLLCHSFHTFHGGVTYGAATLAVDYKTITAALRISSDIACDLALVIVAAAAWLAILLSQADRGKGPLHIFT
jgi:hypothetical protein